MRTMVKVTIPIEAGNKGIKDGTLPKVLMNAIEQLKPEASYFFAGNGTRTGLLVVDMKDPSQIPSICEPFFLNLNAEVELTPVMNLDDLKSGLEKAAQNR